MSIIDVLQTGKGFKCDDNLFVYHIQNPVPVYCNIALSYFCINCPIACSSHSIQTSEGQSFT